MCQHVQWVTWPEGKAAGQKTFLGLCVICKVFIGLHRQPHLCWRQLVLSLWPLTNVHPRGYHAVFSYFTCLELVINDWTRVAPQYRHINQPLCSPSCAVSLRGCRRDWECNHQRATHLGPVWTMHLKPEQQVPHWSPGTTNLFVLGFFSSGALVSCKETVLCKVWINKTHMRDSIEVMRHSNHSVHDDKESAVKLSLYGTSQLPVTRFRESLVKDCRLNAAQKTLLWEFVGIKCGVFVGSPADGWVRECHFVIGMQIRDQMVPPKKRVTVEFSDCSEWPEKQFIPWDYIIILQIEISELLVKRKKFVSHPQMFRSFLNEPQGMCEQ